MDPRVTNVIALVVTFVWGFSFIADIVPMVDYSPSPYIHLAMMSIIGAAYGSKFIQPRNRNGNDDWRKKPISELFKDDEEVM